MKSNTVRTTDGIELYENDVFMYADEYIATLNYPDDIYNTSCFDGMIDYIYTRVFKPKKGQKVLYHNTKNTILDTADIETLDDIWRICKRLCGKYKKRITILRFCTLIGIDKETVSTWINGSIRGPKGGETSSAHSVTAKKWKSEAESALLSGAVDDNSVGCIFALKANHGYTEQPQKIEIIGNNQPQISTEELLRLREERKELPQKPEFD